MLGTVFSFVLFVAFIACDGGNGDTGQATFAVRLSQGDNAATVTVEIAATTTERQQGLMFRQEMAEDAGMLFLFPTDARGGFWMRNTYIPLDIAYIGGDGRVQEIRAAQPLDETNLVPAQPYRYVLEVNQGWFERHGMGIGARVELPEELPAAQ
jgi:uncharacterized membrane protein (UPF0127 family)